MIALPLASYLNGQTWAVTQFLLVIFIDFKKLFKERGVGSFSFDASVTHLGQFLNEISYTPADLERAASFESGTFAGETLALANKDGIWAHGFAKSWTHEHYIFQSDTHGSLKGLRRK